MSTSTWPPKSAPKSSVTNMHEEKGDIRGLMAGDHYDPSKFPGEGGDVTPNEASKYNGDKKPRVPGGTYGFDGVPKVGDPVDPYPEINKELFDSELVKSGFWAGSIALVTETPGNSKIVGDMGTGMPEDGKFSGAARVVGDQITGMPNLRGENTQGGEQGPDAPLVGDLVTGMPTDDYPTDQQKASELSPEGLTTGNTEGAYAPGVNQGNGGRK